TGEIDAGYRVDHGERQAGLPESNRVDLPSFHQCSWQPIKHLAKNQLIVGRKREAVAHIELTIAPIVMAIIHYQIERARGTALVDTVGESAGEGVVRVQCEAAPETPVERRLQRVVGRGRGIVIDGNRCDIRQLRSIHEGRGSVTGSWR